MTTHITREHIRAVGGIVHSDGNVFFTSIEQLNKAVAAPSCRRLDTGTCGCTAYCGAYLSDNAQTHPAPAATVVNSELTELADRIDHEKLWKIAGMYRDALTAEQRDRLDTGVHLRRYADLLGSNSWRIYPPKPNVSFSASTLDAVVAMVRKREKDVSGAAEMRKGGAA